MNPSCLRHHVVYDVPVAGDLAVRDGVLDVSDDHTWDDFYVLDDNPNIYLPVANAAFDEDDEAPSFLSNFMYTTDQIWNGIMDFCPRGSHH
jgi:hypothetical protein